MKRLLLTILAILSVAQPAQAGSLARFFGRLQHGSRKAVVPAMVSQPALERSQADHFKDNSNFPASAVLEAEEVAQKSPSNKSKSKSTFWRKLGAVLGVGLVSYGTGYVQGNEKGEEGKREAEAKARFAAQEVHEARELSRRALAVAESAEREIAHRAKAVLAMVGAAQSLSDIDQNNLVTMVRACQNEHDAFALFDKLVAIGGKQAFDRIMAAFAEGDFFNFNWFADYVLNKYPEVFAQFIKQHANPQPRVSSASELVSGISKGWPIPQYIEPIKWDNAYFDKETTKVFMSHLLQYLHARKAMVQHLLQSDKGMVLLSTLLSSTHSESNAVKTIASALDREFFAKLVPTNTSIYLLNQLLLGGVNRSTQHVIVEWAVANAADIMRLEMGAIAAGSKKITYDQSFGLLYNVKVIAQQQNWVSELEALHEIIAKNSQKGWFSHASYNRYNCLVSEPPK